MGEKTLIVFDKPSGNDINLNGAGCLGTGLI